MRFFSRSKTSILLLLLVIFSACLTLLVSVKASAHVPAPRITLSQRSGPPTASVKISGKNYGVVEAIDVNFDTALVGVTVADSNGIFTLKITVPISASPGMHQIQATGQTSGLAAQASFLVQTNWDEFGFNTQHTHVNPFENSLNPTNVSGLMPDWSYTTGSLVDSSPIIYNGVVYAGSYDHKLYAFNAVTGTLLWSYSTGDAISSSPAVANGVLYVGSYDHNLYALNATTGSLLWTASTGGQIWS
jgi:outer membrane protein assembly factor BamB